MRDPRAPTATGGPLTGLKVLDLTQMLSGPYCTMILTDLGARVLKVEAPGKGDTARASARLPGNDDPKSFGGYFNSINRGKQSLVVDLKADAGKEIIRRLATDSDVVVENFRAGVMDRLGLGYEALRDLNPKLVYGAIRGFGDPRTGESPYADWPAFDVIAQAMGGMMGITGPKGGPPTKIGPGVGDLIPALFMTGGLLAAVLKARETGQGEFVDVAMMDAIMAICERPLYQHTYFGDVAEPEGNAHPLLAPFGSFQCRDGWVAIGCPYDHFWVTLTRIMGCPDMGHDPRFALGPDRARNADACNALVTAFTLQRTKDELADLLGGKVPVGPVKTAPEILTDAHTAARNMLAEVEQPGPGGGTFGIANTPLHFLESPGGVKGRAPELGEHTRAVLADYGYGVEEIDALFAGGVVE